MATKKSVLETDQEALPQRLRELMQRKSMEIMQEDPKAKRVSHDALAKYLGVSRQAVGQYTQGRSAPDWKTIVKIAQFFGVTTDYLLGLESERSHDLHYICYYTGLSEEAVKNISEKKPGDYLFRTTISRFFEKDDLSRRFFRDMQAVTNCYAAVKSELSGYSEVIDQAANSADSAEAERNLSQLIEGREGNSLPNLRNALDSALYAFSLTCGDLFLEEREEIYKGISEQEASIKERLEAQDGKEGRNG